MSESCSLTNIASGDNKMCIQCYIKIMDQLLPFTHNINNQTVIEVDVSSVVMEGLPSDTSVIQSHPVTSVTKLLRNNWNMRVGSQIDFFAKTYCMSSFALEICLSQVRSSTASRAGSAVIAPTKPSFRGHSDTAIYFLVFAPQALQAFPRK